MSKKKVLGWSEKIPNDELQAIDINVEVNPMVAIAGILDKLEDAQTTGLNLVKKHFELEEGEVCKCILIGIGSMQTDSGLIPTVELIDSSKQIYYTASAVINQSLGSAKIGTGVEITYLGEEKLEKGKKLKTYKIELLAL